ncbi:ATP-dependent DNA helicase RecG [Salirhabdus salicampi]|uniref:ATP-dependent DNA helicase RecG n=1 Tax=Salirhabdus salicampi TaxID=476102 RepID=UPI0020C58D0F|nr:ATP-dependent DNA helicase RecG [Salirhabdus salicampi]MCP8616559.1 ATP-dependent DNA helicase RecG [Salirhabdus salicampi]
MLTERVSNIKGIGNKMENDLQDIGIYTIEDLLFYFPFRYDFHEVKPLMELTHNEKATIVGKVVSEPSLSYFGRRKSRLTVTLEVDGIAIKAVLFNQAFAKKHIVRGEYITVTGKWDQHRLQITVNQFKAGKQEDDGSIQGIYSVKGNMTMNRLRKAMEFAVEEYADDVKEILPKKYLVEYKLPARSESVRFMHFPPNSTLLKHAKRRFIYEELLLFQLKMQLLRKRIKESVVGSEKEFNDQKVMQFKHHLPFPLTSAQEKALTEILEDLQSPYRMNRLLQGDVGSGKTIVAAIGLYAAVTAGKQGALMVPTEILAEQHYESLSKLFSDFVKVELLTGSVKGKKRVELLNRVEQGKVDIVVGTHALIQDDVQFADLGFVIVDEQHRFGVEQRRVLREKGLKPDVLFMTATPIPRTLAISAFGDLDVSVIDEMPQGRKPVETYWAKPNKFDRVMQFIQKEVDKGHQAYMICPLIEESDKLDIQNAVDLYELLQQHFPPNVKLGLMHGRLHSDEKDDVMKKFAQGEIDVLVSTTVVEVGVNVPNATVMVIYDADRFGLSQLHQLRGRVGRGDAQSYCILLADPKGDTGKERMRIMQETTDGFELSEQDLKLRGPGDFFGKKQSGLPEFKVADIVEDYRALETARKDAVDLIRTNKLFEQPELQLLRRIIENDPMLKDAILD